MCSQKGVGGREVLQAVLVRKDGETDGCGIAPSHDCSDSLVLHQFLGPHGRYSF